LASVVCPHLGHAISWPSWSGRARILPPHLGQKTSIVSARGPESTSSSGSMALVGGRRDSAFGDAPWVAAAGFSPLAGAGRAVKSGGRESEIGSGSSLAGGGVVAGAEVDGLAALCAGAAGAPGGAWGGEGASSSSSTSENTSSAFFWAAAAPGFAVGAGARQSSSSPRMRYVVGSGTAGVDLGFQAGTVKLVLQSGQTTLLFASATGTWIRALHVWQLTRISSSCTIASSSSSRRYVSGTGGGAAAGLRQIGGTVFSVPQSGQTIGLSSSSRRALSSSQHLLQ
jgi:hypothetical protein